MTWISQDQQVTGMYMYVIDHIFVKTWINFSHFFKVKK